MGSISIAQPVRLWVLVAAVTVLTGSLVALLVLGEYSYRSRVRGHLVPDSGVSSVLAPATGVVARVYVPEGRKVEVGEPLVRIEVPHALPDGRRVVTATREALNAQVDSLEMSDAASIAQWSIDRDTLYRQLQRVRGEIRQVEESIATRQRQVALARATLERFRGISDTNVVSRLQVEQQELAWLDGVSQRQALELKAAALHRDVLQLQQNLRKMPAQRQAQAATKRSLLAQLQHQRIQEQANGEVLLKAPVSGQVATNLIESGQSVRVGQLLVSLLPRDSRLQAHLWIPSRTIGFVRPGDAVLLRYAAYPYQKFGHARGRVERITSSAVQPDGLESTAVLDGTSEAYFRVVVVLESQSMLAYGNEEALRPGMALEADIVGERRRLYEWLLEPLYALSGRLS
jgi:membrane fusion protein